MTNSRYIFRTICFVCATLSLLCYCSCSTKKSASGSEYMPAKTADQRFDAIIDTYTPWSTFSTSGKVRIATGTNSLSSGIQFRMIRDSVISISIRPFLGIEVMRIHIDSDSAFLIDKTHKSIVALGLRQFTNTLPLTISNLQDMFLSRAFLIGEGTLSNSSKKKVRFKIAPLQSYSTHTSPGNDPNFIIVPSKQYPDLSYGFTFNSFNEMCSLIISISSDQSEPWCINYFRSANAQHQTIPSEVSISTTINETPMSLSVSFDTAKLKWDSPISSSPNLPPSYRRISFKQFIKLW